MVCQLQLIMFYSFDMKARKFTNIYKTSAQNAVCIYASVEGDLGKGGGSECPACLQALLWG